MFDESQVVLVEKLAPRSCHVDAAFVKLPRGLTEMPASDAAAERAISIFEFIVDKTWISSDIDLIQAQLMMASRLLADQPPRPQPAPGLRRPRGAVPEEKVNGNSFAVAWISSNTYSHPNRLFIPALGDGGHANWQSV
jgi:hypothetical protein